MAQELVERQQEDLADLAAVAETVVVVALALVDKVIMVAQDLLAAAVAAALEQLEQQLQDLLVALEV